MRNRVAVSKAEDLTLEKLIPIVDDYRQITPSKSPLCIIKYGPPGSGKSSADALVEKLFDVNLNQFAKIDKDAPLIAIDEFRKGSMEIIKKYPGLRYKEQPVQKKVVELQERILSTKDSDGLSITDKIPIVMQRAFDYNFNILWETTCQSSGSQQLMDHVFKTIPRNYRIIVLFPIISLKTAKQRVLNRANAHLQQDPPYYRPVPHAQVSKAHTNSYSYFTNNIVPKVMDGTIYQLFCYNNEADSSKTRTSRYRRLAPGWQFGLNSTGAESIIKNARVSRKKRRHIVE
jgi:hypothetical protein